MNDPIPVHIRWMIRCDMPEVLAIEAESFEFPSLEEDFIRWLRGRNCIGMVAVHDDRIVGLMIYELHKRRIAILDFAVAANFRRRGVGSQMVAKLKAKLSAGRRNRLRLKIRESNLPGQLFFKSQGFRGVAVLRGEYSETDEDAYVMRYRLGDESERWQPRNRISKVLTKQEARHEAGGGQGTDQGPQ